jgi:hypothetical protein
MNINELMAQVNQGYARPNRYKVIFTLPRGVTFTGDIRQLALNCQSAQLPGVALTATEERTYGVSRRIPNNRTYQEWTASFYCSRDLREKVLFENWIAAIQDPNTDDLNFFDEYKADLEVQQIDQDGKPSYRMRLKEAYPLSTGSIDISYGSTNTITTIAVNFTYTKFEKL